MALSLARSRSVLTGLNGTTRVKLSTAKLLSSTNSMNPKVASFSSGSLKPYEFSQSKRLSSLPLPRLSVSTRLISSVHAEKTSTYATVSDMEPHVHCIKNKINDAEAGYKILQETYKALPPVVKVLRESRTSVWKTQSELEVGDRVITDLEADMDEIMRAAKDCIPVFERTRKAWEKMLACGGAAAEECAEALQVRAALTAE